MKDFFGNEVEDIKREEKSPEELREIAKNQVGKKSERPMGMVDMDAIKAVMRGESPTFSVSLYKPSSVVSPEDEEKDNRHKVLQDLRKELNPTFCPKCGKFMDKHRLNEKFYRLRGMCFECVIKMENQLRLDGKWEIYENKIIVGNKLGFLKDVKQQAEDYLNIGLKKVNEFVDSEGKIEKWTNNQYDETKTYIEEQLVEINGYIEDLSKYYEELEEQLNGNPEPATVS